MKKGHLNPADRNLGECWMKKQNYNHWLNDLENITRCFLVLFFLNTQGKEGLTVKFVWILLELIIRL